MRQVIPVYSEKLQHDIPTQRALDREVMQREAMRGLNIDWFAPIPLDVLQKVHGEDEAIERQAREYAARLAANRV